MFATLSIIYWTIHYKIMLKNVKNKLTVFLWVLIVLLVLHVCFFHFERDFMYFLSDNNEADVVEAFNSTSRYLA